MEIKEVLDVIDSINIDLYNNYGGSKEEAPYLTLITDGFNNIINFLDIRLWYDEDDERDYNEEAGEYEDLEGFLRKRIKAFIKNLSYIFITL